MAKHTPIKETLRNSEALPEEFSWEAMEGGILAKMEAISEPKRKVWTLPKVALSIVVVGLVSLVICLSYVTLTKSEDTPNIASAKIDTNGAAPEPTHLATAIQTQRPSSQQPNSTTVSETQSSQLTQHTTGNEITHTTHSNSSSPVKIKYSDAISSTQSTIAERAQLLLSTQSNSINTAFQNKKVTENENNDEINATLNTTANQALTKTVSAIATTLSTALSPIENNLEIVQKLPSLPTPGLATEVTKLEFSESDILGIDALLTNAEKVENYTTEKLKKQLPLTLSIGAGTTLWTPNYKGTAAATAQNQYEHSQLGQSLSVGISYALSPTWSIGTGLNRQILQSKLDYFAELDTLVLKNVLVSQDIHPISGAVQNQVYADSLLQGTYTRTVIHHNTIKNYSIPLVLSRSSSVGKQVRLDIGAGINYTVSSKSKGKEIQEQIDGSNSYIFATYTEENQPLSARQTLDLLAVINLDYQVSRHVSIGVGMQGRQAMRNWSLRKGTSLKPFVLGGDIRLGYKF